MLGYVDIDGDPNLPGHEECMIRDPGDGPAAALHRGPGRPSCPPKRIHLDIAPREGTRDDEVARLVAHGAVVVADHRGKYGPGTGWVTLADPEGNQLCVLRNDAEQAAQSVVNRPRQPRARNAVPSSPTASGSSRSRSSGSSPTAPVSPVHQRTRPSPRTIPTRGCAAAAHPRRQAR